MYKNKFHLTENGPKPCHASIRDCPIGGAHFETKEEAARAFEFKAAKKFSPFGGLKKQVNPYTKHIQEADKRIAALEKEMKIRDQRQIDGTLYHELLADGVTQEELENRFNEETHNRQATISHLGVKDGEALPVGIAYGGDYKAEEEWGIAHISQALAKGEYEPDDVLLYTKGDMTILAIKGEQEYGWTNNPESNETVARAEKDAVDRYNRYTPNDMMRLKWKLERVPVAELRKELKGKVTPLPKTKAETIQAVLKLRMDEPFRTPAMGEFQTGRALVMVTKDPLEAKLMKKLKESHNSGNLRVGGSANPFGRASMFYDDRDLSRERKSELIRSEEASKAAKAYIADTRSELEKGGSLFAVSTRVDGDLKDVRESKYWLNFSPRGRKQVFGLFDKEQLTRISKGDYSDLKEDN